jgi:hypothetical protein
MEQWKQSVDYPTFELSSEGRIRNRETGTVRVQTLNGAGYLQIVSRHHGNIRIHQEVCKLFKGDTYKPGSVVNHLDGNKTNNTVSNLEWTTSSFNTKHAWDNGLMENVRVAAKKNGKKMAKLNLPASKRVECLNDGKQFDSVGDAARHYSFKANCVSRVCRGERRAHKQMMFQYI